MKIYAAFAAITALLGGVEAHGGVQGYRVAGRHFPSVKQSGNSIQRSWANGDPLLDMNSNSIRCNSPGQSASQSATVRPGDEVVAWWQYWPHPRGPVTVWMAKCPGSCSSYDGSGKNWFKISEAGLYSGTIAGNDWGMGRMMNNNGSWTAYIPKGLANGEYLMRHELLSLHDPGKPQFYPQCIHLTVTEGGSATPPSDLLTSIPGVYQRSDPSLNINMYAANPPRSWTPIGPKPWVT